MKRQEDKLRNRIAFAVFGVWPERVVQERLATGGFGRTFQERVVRTMTDPRRV